MKTAFTFLLLLSGMSYANDSDYVVPELYCPKVTDLKQTNLKWHAETTTKWQAVEESFVTEVTSFVGAQWQGIKVGQISCIYRGAEKNTFPIVLENNRMFKQPENPNWIKAGDSYNCLDNNVTNCPLYPYIEKEAPKNLYELLDSIKH